MSAARSRGNYQIELLNLFPFTRGEKQAGGLDATSATPELRELHISAEKRSHPASLTSAAVFQLIIVFQSVHNMTALSLMK
jgi:hypothetical protein